jgi:hypothetical protein
MSKKPITEPRSAQWYAEVKRESREAIARIKARDEAWRKARAEFKAAQATELQLRHPEQVIAREVDRPLCRHPAPPGCGHERRGNEEMA